MSATGTVKAVAIISGKLALAVIISTAVSRSPANAYDFTAEKVMKEMDAKERYVFTAGVIEGLAVARYMKDGKKSEGMNCIYGWFYEDKKTKDTIYAAYERYPSFPPGSIIDTLAKRKCGE